jgi:hypothetical protein
LCEHAFVTSQGSAHARFARAIQRRNLFQAEFAAREMGGLSLYEALDLCALIAEEKPERLERAVVRWHGRLELEAATLTLAEARFALAALERLQVDPQAVEMLGRLLRQAKPTLVRGSA